MKTALALALLVLCCGCDRRPATPNASSVTTSAPTRAPDTATPAKGDRFIVCPGDRRCPRRKDGQSREGAD